MQKLITKGDLLYQADGYAVYDTDHPDYTIIEWEQEEACSLALLMHEILKRHALCDSCDGRYGTHSLVTRRLELLPLTVLAHSTRTDTHLTFYDESGKPIDLETVKGIEGCKPARLDYMTDTAAHAARIIRAHLHRDGLEELELKLRFGVATAGDCCLQVVNPLECQLGLTDLDELYTELGGDLK